MRRLLSGALMLASALAPAACSGDDAATVGRSPDATESSVAAGPTATTAPPRVLESAAAVAAELDRTETAIRNPSTPEADLPALGRAQQMAYLALDEHPAWDAEVSALVAPPLRPVVAANVAAGRAIKRLNGPIEDGRPLPRWRIVPPEPAADLLAHYRGAGQASGVPWPYLAAIHLVETRMGRIQGDSVAGAQGPMQFIPTTWAIYGQGGDIRDTRDAVYAAARLLRANGAPSNMARALRSYNNDVRYVQAVTAYAEQIQADERAYLGYHAWQVHFGPLLLPEGWVGPS